MKPYVNDMGYHSSPTYGGDEFNLTDSLIINQIKRGSLDFLCEYFDKLA